MRCALLTWDKGTPRLLRKKGTQATKTAHKAETRQWSQSGYTRKDGGKTWQPDGRWTCDGDEDVYKFIVVRTGLDSFFSVEFLALLNRGYTLSVGDFLAQV